MSASSSKGGGISLTKDGRVYVHASFAATLGRSKFAFIVGVAVTLLLLLWGPGVLGERTALKRRVRELEARLGKRVGWLFQHQNHLREHLSAPALPAAPHADGRMHLRSAHNGPSLLAEAIAPELGLAVFDDHYLCGTGGGDVIKKKVALAVVTWHSRRVGGVLDIVDERMMFANDAQPEDVAIAAEFGFDFYTTDKGDHGGNVMAGPALAYLVGNSSADYVLFMEKDMVLTADKATMLREMWTGVQHLSRGVDVYRLRGKSDWPAEGMPDCCAPTPPGGKPNCPYTSHWASGGWFSDHMNWLLIYCDPDIMEHSGGRLAHCTSEPQAPDSYCYTSGDTNWTNNPVLFGVAWFNAKLRQFTLEGNPELYTKNEMFEVRPCLRRQWGAPFPPHLPPSPPPPPPLPSFL